MSPWIISPLICLRFKKWWGVALGALYVWLIPVIVRTTLAMMGLYEYAGFGVLVHMIFGFPFGLAYCSLVRLVAHGLLNIKNKLLPTTPETPDTPAEES